MMTDAELTVLSLIAEQARHGYEIEQTIEERGMREWTEIGFSSIYYLLKKLETKGLIEGRLEEAERGPARKVYHATPAGREALHDAMLEALSVPQSRNSRLMLAVGNLPAVSPAEALAALQQYRDSLTERLAHMEGRWEAQRPLPYFVDALFEYSAKMIRAESGWIEQFIQRLEEQSG